ncbi:MAG TPA: hypothetical protein ACHBX0_11540 [Arsenophonus sp.]
MSALKAVVPIIANHKKGSMPSFVLFYCYMLDIFLAAIVAVIVVFLISSRLMLVVMVLN